MQIRSAKGHENSLIPRCGSVERFRSSAFNSRFRGRGYRAIDAFHASTYRPARSALPKPEGSGDRRDGVGHAPGRGVPRAAVSNSPARLRIGVRRGIATFVELQSPNESVSSVVAPDSPRSTPRMNSSGSFVDLEEAYLSEPLRSEGIPQTSQAVGAWPVGCACIGGDGEVEGDPQCDSHGAFS
jgi:hypothetical protein